MKEIANMKYTYTKKHLSKYTIDNVSELLDDPKFQALIVEKKIAEDANSSFVNKAGYDEINPEKGRIETKFTIYTLPSGELRINSAGENKRGKFDILRIVDGVNERIFEIPHDEYFNKGKRYGGEFRWSSSYNKSDNIKVNNTSLLLKYEITK